MIKIVTQFKQLSLLISDRLVSSITHFLKYILRQDLPFIHFLPHPFSFSRYK